MPTAVVGPENPLPMLFGGSDLHAIEDAGDADEEMRLNIGYGRVSSVLPYLVQDGYTRERSVVEHRVAVLENDVLRATFLLGAGGRLWSLEHKATGRELLHRNEAFQPANLALRNAWFAGGIEWNIGTIGHTPTTCEPLHAVRVVLPDGTPVLRLYEFERIREVVFQIDAWLPAGSENLLVHVLITNPNAVEVPMYWWSNIAVPEAADVRVLAPADAAWKFGYDGRITRVPMPYVDGLDRSYTTKARDAAEYFFDIDKAARPWIAALDGGGTGLAQSSTSRMRGRKLFLWGQGDGGAHWQDWLSPEGGRYLEIQAGLARTQFEHLPMPARAQWSWVESYGLLKADPTVVHGEDWTAARALVGAQVERLAPAAWLEERLREASTFAAAAPSEVLQMGSGWGALERELRSSHGDSSVSRPGTPFSDAMLGPLQEPWLELLHSGRISPTSPHDAPATFQVSPRWRVSLEPATGWLPLLHLGVARAATGDIAGAAAAWRESLAAEPNAWAWRNLGSLMAAQGDLRGACDAYAQACALAPGLLPLTVERLRVMLEQGDHTGALTVIESLPAHLRSAGRIRLAEARAAVGCGDLARCGRLLAEGLELADIREGDGVLHDTWFDYHAAVTARREGREVDDALLARVKATVEVPRSMDFRMSQQP